MAKPAAPKKPAAAAGTLSLKITLLGTKPPVWRRVLVPGSLTLGELHLTIQMVMGWHNCHMHDFIAGGRRYGDPSLKDEFEAMGNENRERLSALVKSGVSRFRYVYDYGDHWDHDILIEKRPPAGAVADVPTCVAGKRNCPPEDCGGPWGYAELLQILADPAHPQHEEQLEWIGVEFDPEKFSIADANAMLAASFKRT